MMVEDIRKENLGEKQYCKMSGRRFDIISANAERAMEMSDETTPLLHTLLDGQKGTAANIKFFFVPRHEREKHSSLFPENCAFDTLY